MNIKQTRPPNKTRNAPPAVKVPKNIDVKIARDKVVVQDRNLITIHQFGIRTIIYKDQLEDWRLKGWKTDQDLKDAANKELNQLIKKD